MVTTLERKQAAAAKARAAKRKKKRFKSTRHKPTAGIEPQVTYPLELVANLFGISRHTLQKAQAEGLRTSKLGSRKFVEGRVLIEFLRERSE